MHDTTYAAAAPAALRERLSTLDTATTLWWILRVACAMCYIGHGAFGIIGKEEWLPFFAVAGIPADAARMLMPVIGAVDIALGISVLIAPRRAVVLYMAVWAVWTAALRPITGDSVFELLERAGNYGVPLAFLIFLGPARTTREAVGTCSVPALTRDRAAQIGLVLRWTTALLLIGHGALAAIVQKPMLGAHMEAIGLPASAAIVTGWIEIVLALLVLAHPRPALLLGVVVWKLSTEMLFPIAGAPVWEFIERGGSYGAPLALALLMWYRARVAAGTRFTGAPRRAIRHAGIAVLVVSAALGTPIIVQAQESGSAATRIDDAALVAGLRRGGFVLLFRHTETQHDARDRGPAREDQRNLTADGERHAREIGDAIRALGIPIGEIRASHMYRTMETAQLAFGRVERDSTLRGPQARQSLRAQLSAPVATGTNRVLLSHNGNMQSALEGHGAGRMAEGDIVIVEPLGDGEFRVLARLGREDWARLASARR